MELTNDRELISNTKQAAIGIKDQIRKLWMKRFDDEVIRDQKMFLTKLYYINKKPVKSGLEVNTELGGIDLCS